MIKETDSAKIARIEEKVVNLKEWAEDHGQKDDQRFERMFGYLKDSFDKIDNRFDKFDSKVDLLWDDKNRRLGMFTMSRMIWGCFYSILALVGAAVGSKWHQ